MNAKIRHISLIAGAALALTACSSDEPGVTATDGLITFRVAVGADDAASSRCGQENRTQLPTYEVTTDNMGTTLNHIRLRMLKSGTNESVFTSSDNVEWLMPQGSGPWTSADAWYIHSGTKYYWKDAGASVDLFALASNATGCDGNDWTPLLQKNDAGEIYGWVKVENQRHPIDILYGSTLNFPAPTGSDGSIGITLNHAMTKVTFDVCNTDRDLKVEITDVRLDNVHQGGNFYIKHNRSDLHAGLWEPNGTRVTMINGVDGNPMLAPVTLDGETGTQVLKFKDNSDGTRGTNQDFMFLAIPHRLAVWSKDQTSVSVMMVKCRVTKKSSGQVIYDSDTASTWVYLPLTPGSEPYDWLPGKQYRYSLTFGKGAGFDGYGNKILVPLSLRATVVPFTTVDMNIPVS